LKQEVKDEGIISDTKPYIKIIESPPLLSNTIVQSASTDSMLSEPMN